MAPVVHRLRVRYNECDAQGRRYPRARLYTCWFAHIGSAGYLG
jgi:hypothetical protein